MFGNMKKVVLGSTLVGLVLGTTCSGSEHQQQDQIHITINRDSISTLEDSDGIKFNITGTISNQPQDTNDIELLTNAFKEQLQQALNSKSVIPTVENLMEELDKFANFYLFSDIKIEEFEENIQAKSVQNENDWKNVKDDILPIFFRSDKLVTIYNSFLKMPANDIEATQIEKFAKKLLETRNKIALSQIANNNVVLQILLWLDAVYENTKKSDYLNMCFLWATISKELKLSNSTYRFEKYSKLIQQKCEEQK